MTLTTATRTARSASVALLLAVGLNLPCMPATSRAVGQSVATCDAPVQTVASRTVGLGEGRLTNIAVAPDGLWAVGGTKIFDSRYDQPLIQRWDGARWRTAETPTFTTPGTAQEGAAVLRAVGVAAANDVWAVGYIEPAPTGVYAADEALVLRWNGAAWSRTPNSGALSSFTRLYDIAVLSPNNIWVVGTSRSGDIGLPAMARWNGSAWSASTVPGPADYGALTAISAAGANAIWAVGFQAVGSSSVTNAVLMRYDGATWARLPAPANTGSLFDVDTSPDGAVWAVGEHYGMSIALRWDGAQFQRSLLPINDLTTIAVSADNDVWAAGTSGAGGTLLHWDGVAWEQSAHRSDAYQNTGYNALLATNSGDLWVVGYAGAQRGRTLVQRLQSQLTVGIPRIVKQGVGQAVALDVSLDAPAAVTVRAAAHTIDAGAVAGRDYTAVKAEITIPPCALSATVLVPLVAGATPPADAAFRVILERASGARPATATRLVRLGASYGRVALPLIAKSAQVPAGRLAYVAVTGDTGTNLDIYTAGVEGNAPRQLTTAPGRDQSPAWSPDGTHIAFISDRDGNAELYMMDDTGSGQRRLASSPAIEMEPAWSPDGTQIAFISNRSGQFFIYLLNVLSGAVRRLSPSGTEIEAGYLDWSPDGRSIVFSSGGANHPGLFLLSLDGSLRQLTDQLDGFPTWSPDGRQIAFVGQHGRLTGLYSIQPDGGNLHEVNPNFDIGPAAWSPDGNYLVFGSMATGTLAITDLSAKEPILVKVPQANPFSPVWASSR